jgi:hypothetical protein
MTTCEHDCEFCERLADCGENAAERWRQESQAALEATHNGEPEANPRPSLEPFYVYVAGRLSGDPAEYLANLHDMCAMSRQLMEAGYVPVNPGADALEGLMSGEVLPTSHYQSRSMDLLRLLTGHRAAIIVGNMRHRDGSISGGTAREIEEAQRLGIPVVWSREELARVRGSGP